MFDQELQDVIQKSLEPDPWDGRWKGVGAFGGGYAVEVEVAELLHGFVRAIKPKVVVETGTHKGFSALVIAKALQQNGEGHLYTVDMKDHQARALLQKFGVAQFVTVSNMHSSQFLRAVHKDVVIDLLWLDADHTKEAVLEEFTIAAPHLRAGSYIGFHDTIIDPREDAAVQEIRKRNPSWDYIRCVTARGFDLMRVR